MKTSLASAEGARLLEEAKRFALRHRCDDCVHFDDATGVCGHGYPTIEHRSLVGSASGEIVFCKEFELA